MTSVPNVLRDRLHGNVSRGAAGTFLLRATLVGLEFLVGIAVARRFGAASFGEYAQAMSAVALLSIPAACGFDRLLVREVAGIAGERDWCALKGLLRFSSRVVVTVACLIALATAAAIQASGRNLTATEAATFTTAMLLVPLTAFARIRQAAIQGFGRVAVGQVPEALVQPIVMLALVTVAGAATWLPRTGFGAMSLQCAAGAAACVVGIVLLRRNLPPELASAEPCYRAGAWLHSAAPLVWTLAMNVVLTSADTLLVGMLMDAQSAGVYRVASQMGMLVAFPVTAINLAVAPRISTLYRLGRLDDLARLAVTAARWSTASAVAAVAVVVALGQPMLSLYGPGFEEGYVPMILIAAAYLVSASVGASGYLLIMTRFERAAAWSFTLAAVAAAGGVLALVPIWGLEGAALATGFGIITLAVSFAIAARVGLGFGSTVFSRVTVVAAAGSSDRPAQPE